MTTQQTQAIQLLALPADHYARFDDALKQQLQERLAALFDAPDPSRTAPPPPVLVLGAPAEVAATTAAPAPPVPILVGSVRSGGREWQVNFRTNLHVFVRRLDGQGMAVIQPLRNLRRGGPELASSAGSPPTGIAAKTVLSDVMRVDLRERVEPALAPGRYAVTAIAADWLSNTVSVRVGAPPGAPAVREDAPAPYGGLRHVMDARAGLPTQVEVTPTVTGAEPARMRVALSLAQDAVTPSGAADGHALWSAHVVLVALDEVPVMVPLRVPVQRSADAGQARYNAVFQLDLKAAVPGLTGRRLVYLEAGTAWLGPFPLNVLP